MKMHIAIKTLLICAVSALLFVAPDRVLGSGEGAGSNRIIVKPSKPKTTKKKVIKKKKSTIKKTKKKKKKTKKKKINQPKYTKGKDYLRAKRGPDILTGGPGNDVYLFSTDSDFPNSKSNSLDNGDRIRDYESEEVISISGIILSQSQVTLKFDKKKNQTRLQIDLNKDGKTDRTITLDGDKRGTVQVDANCCGTRTSEVSIKLPK